MVAALANGMGLGAYLSVGPELVERLEAGSPPPGGVAVVRAAADWYRAGLTRPAPADLVRDLYPHYLPDHDATLLDQYDEALVWATTPVSGARLVTRRTDGSGLAVHDYLLDHLTHTLAPGLPAPTWTAIATALHQDPDALNTAGATAYLSHHDNTTAEQLVRAAADTGHTIAMTNLGVLLEVRGETGEAEPLLRAAADTGYTPAMFSLGVLLARRGGTGEAEPLIRAAADTGRTLARFSLGVVLEQLGETGEAERWYRTAADRGHAGAMHNLGLLLEERGETGEAERWYRTAANVDRTENNR